MYKKILIIADIEGSSGCAGYDASSFNTPAWYNACIDLSLDMDAVAARLYKAGAETVYIKDFHRTGYNLLPELIDKRARVIHGYKEKPVPGIGGVYGSEAVMFIGMHASSGSDGFLAHTLTSRYSSITAGGRSVSELQLFASSLSGFAVNPVFFSGCPAACAEALDNIKGIDVFPVLKDQSGNIDKKLFRVQLADAAALSLENKTVLPYIMQPPFTAELKMRDGAAAAEKTARRWGLYCSNSTISFTAEDFQSFYRKLVSITYFTPLLEKITPAALFLFNIYGRAGLTIVRWKRRTVIKKLIHK